MHIILGFSLTDLLLGLFSGTLLLSMLLSTVIHIKSNYHKTEQLLEENLDLAFISDLVQDHIRKAGFTPCLNVTQLESADTRLVPYSKLQDLEIITPQKFKINRMDEWFWTLSEFNLTDRVEMPGTNSYAIKNVIISDCFHAEIHRVKSTIKHKKNTDIILEKPIIFKYENPTYVGIWREEIFYFDSLKKSLLLHLDKADELSYHVLDMQVKLVKHNIGRLLTIVWQLADDKRITLSTASRMNG